MTRKKAAGGRPISGPNALRAWRQRTNTSQKRLAELMGLKHNSSITWYECGKFPFTYAHLVDLQRITGISVWTLASKEQRAVMRAIALTPMERAVEAVAE